MRYLRWIAALLFLLFLIMELAYNFQTSTQSFKFIVWVPGKTLATLEMEIWVALIITFILGFGLAIVFELYYWGKYSLSFRKQSKIIEELKKTIDFFKRREPKPPDAQTPAEPENAINEKPETRNE